LKAVILAGGQGKRLRPLTLEVPKPLVTINDKPIILWQIEWLKKYGIKEFLICVGYLKEKIINALGNGSRFGVKIGYVVEEEPLGTGCAIKNAEAFLRNEKDGFFVLNGDIITNLNPLELTKINDDVIGSIALVPLPSPYGIVEIDENSYIVTFREKPILPSYWINAGVYYFKPSIFDYLPEKGDIEKHTFPKLAEKKLIKAIKYKNIFWKSIDTVKDLEEASKMLSGKNVFT